MKQSMEVEFCKNLFYVSGRSKVESIIGESNLTNRERELVRSRYIEGLSVKEICSLMGIEEESYKKLHRRILSKLYIYIQLNGAA